MTKSGRRKQRKKTPPPAPADVQQREPPQWQWWLLAAAVPLVLCASRLDLDLWYDEAYTLENFVSKPFAVIATDYSAPNNHVLYSLLLRPVYLVSDSEFFLRLPSLLFTVGTLVMVFRMTRRWAGVSAAMSATLWLGLTQTFLIHTIQVRGYGLSMFLAAWLGDLAVSDPPATRWRRLPAIAMIGAGFLYVLPTNVLFLIPLAVVAVVWTAVRERHRRSILLESGAWAAACVLAGLLYWTIVDQVLAAGGDRRGVSVLSVLRLAHGVFAAAMRDWLLVLPIAAAGLIAWGREISPQRSGSPQAAGLRSILSELPLPLVTLALLTGPFVLTALIGVLPFPRNYSSMLPFVAVAMGCLLTRGIQAVARVVSLKWSEEAIALVGVLLLALVALPSIWTYPARLAEVRRQRFAQDGYYNYYAADFHPSRVVSYLQESTGNDAPYRVFFAKADFFPLSHYFRRAGMPLQRLDAGFASSRPALYFIAPELVDYEALSESSRLPPEMLRGFKLVDDFGYYRLYRLPEIRSLAYASGYDW